MEVLIRLFCCLLIFNLIFFSSCSLEKKMLEFDLNLVASNKIDRYGNRQGLWEEKAEDNTHFNYWCLDAEFDEELILEKGLILVKGYYKDNKPIGVWKKYMPKLDSSFTEFFYYENGECYKHQYFDHHNGGIFIDSLNLTKDTVISFAKKYENFACFYFSNGKKGNFNILTMSYLYPHLNSNIYYTKDKYKGHQEKYMELHDSITGSIISVYSEHIYSDSIWKRYISFEKNTGYIVIQNNISGSKDSTLIIYKNGVIKELKEK